MIKIYQIAIGNIPKDIDLLMAGVASYAAVNGHAYECIKPKYQGEPFFLSDILRIQLLCDDPTALYCDWDYSFLSPMIFDLEDKPYFGFNEFNIPHFSLMYCNNHQSFFQKIFMEKAERKIEDCINWPMKIIRDKSNDVYKIKDSCFQHAQHSTKKTLFYAQKIARKLEADTMLINSIKEVM